MLYKRKGKKGKKDKELEVVIITVPPEKPEPKIIIPKELPKKDPVVDLPHNPSTPPVIDKPSTPPVIDRPSTPPVIDKPSSNLNVASPATPTMTSVTLQTRTSILDIESSTLIPEDLPGSNTDGIIINEDSIPTDSEYSTQVSPKGRLSTPVIVTIVLMSLIVLGMLLLLLTKKFKFSYPSWFNRKTLQKRFSKPIIDDGKNAARIESNSTSVDKTQNPTKNETSFIDLNDTSFRESGISRVINHFKSKYDTQNDRVLVSVQSRNFD